MCLCCVSLRGVTYFMVNVHMLGSFGLCALFVHVYFFQPFSTPEGLEDINPLFIQNFPLVASGYSFAAGMFACFIYRAVDMESLFQLTWSVVSFGGFQFLIIFLHFIFTVMFRDLVATQWQILFVAVLILNFSATFVYLTTLFLFGKKIHVYKYGQSIRNSIGNNLPIHSASSGVKKLKNNRESVNANPNPDMNLLENHPPVSRTNSVCKSTSTEDDLDAMERGSSPLPTPLPHLPLEVDTVNSPPPPVHPNSPPPSYQSSPDA